MTATLRHLQESSRFIARGVITSFLLVMALPCLLAGWLVFWLGQLPAQEAQAIGQAARLAPLALALLLFTAWAGLLRLTTGAGGMRAAIRRHWPLVATAGLLFAFTLLITRHLLAHSPGWTPLDNQLLALGLTLLGVLATLGLGAAVGYRIACRLDAARH